ncbi:unnamed protein product, partial [Owenia fusiformis]
LHPDRTYFGEFCENLDGGYCPPISGQCSATCGGGTREISEQCACPSPRGDGAVCKEGLDYKRTIPCNTNPCPIIQCRTATEIKLSCPEGTAIGLLSVVYGYGNALCSGVQRGCGASRAFKNLNSKCRLARGQRECVIPVEDRD